MNKIIILLLLTPLISSCSSLGLSALNATSKLESNHQVIENLAYGNQEWQTLDIHTSEQNSSNTAPEAIKPVIIFLYGGGWTSGQKNQYYFAASAFTDKGYIVVLPDYVKYPEGRFPKFVHDSAKATAWVKHNIGKYGGNADQLYVVGHSAGAHIGALLVADEQYLLQEGLQTKDISAFAGLAGPYNFTPEEKPYTEIFGPKDQFPNMKIMNFIDGSEPPMLLLHGTKDKTVGILNKDSLIETIKNKGGLYGDITYTGESHIGILLNLHPYFDGKNNPANDIDQFFKLYGKPTVSKMH